MEIRREINIFGKKSLIIENQKKIFKIVKNESDDQNNRGLYIYILNKEEGTECAVILTFEEIKKILLSKEEEIINKTVNTSKGDTIIRINTRTLLENRILNISLEIVRYKVMLEEFITLNSESINKIILFCKGEE